MLPRFVRGLARSARAPRRCLGGLCACGRRVANVCRALRGGCPANVSGAWFMTASDAHRWRESALRIVQRLRQPRVSVSVGVGVAGRCAAQCHGIWFNSHLTLFSKLEGTAHTVRFVGSSSACHCAQRLETPADPWRNILHALSHVGSGIYARFEIRVKWCDRARLRKATPRIHGSRPKHATVVGWRLVWPPVYFWMSVSFVV